MTEFEMNSTTDWINCNEIIVCDINRQNAKIQWVNLNASYVYINSVISYIYNVYFINF